MRRVFLPLRCVAIGLLLAAGTGVAPGASRAGTVFFIDGRGMEIIDAWIDADGLIRLKLPEGGVIGTSPERVARVVFPVEVDEEPEPAVETTAGRGELRGLVSETARRYGLDERLVLAVVQTESGFDPDALSPVGAAGLMQLMPATAADLDVGDAFDPEQNVDGGVRYLRGMLDRFDGRLELALAAYNAGPAAVHRYGGIPPFPETRDYVSRVLELARH